VPPIAGPDGAVYVGSVDGLTRISPSGQIDWTFFGDTHIAGSAAIGPDGTVYAGIETGGIGLVALDPQTGALLWSNAERTLICVGCSNELRLGRSAPDGPIDRIYVYWDSLLAFSLDGDFLWAGFGDLDPHEVAVGSDGALYAPHLDDLVAYDPVDGNWLWSDDGPWLAGISDVEVGPDDTLYFVSDGRWIDAYDPGTQTSLWHVDKFDWLRRPSVSPDGSVLIASGGGSCSAEQGCVIPFLEAFDTADGAELWHLDLNEAWDPEFRSIAWDHARVSADSRTAYFTGFILGSHDAADQRSLLWAIDLGGPELFCSSFETADTSGWTQTVP
jgi:outer membrane protein assembly factor BamB